MSTLSRMKIKNCVLVWKKDNIFFNYEKVSCLSYNKRDFIEKHSQLSNIGGKKNGREN